MHSTQAQMAHDDERRTGAPDPEPLTNPEEPTGGMDTTPEDGPPDEPLQEGESPGAGTYQCTHCGQLVVIGDSEPLPSCPSCGDTYDPSTYTKVP